MTCYLRRNASAPWSQLVSWLVFWFVGYLVICLGGWLVGW